ncbi:MAG: exodeoxyribonuclease VII large subunit, partial [Puniceicoccales bacterium]
MALDLTTPHDDAILSVGDFTRQVKELLESNLPPCWVRGEISNLRRQQSGHVYFTLKDSRSQLSCVLFRGDAMRQRAELRDGLQVVVYGQVSVYEPRGTHQLICRVVMEDGAGRLQQEFERLKQKLSAE